MLYENDLKQDEIDLFDIFLDPNNPRFDDLLTKVPDKRTIEDSVQSAARSKLLDRFGVEELVGSILHNGFLPLDRIVVRRLDGHDGKYVVVEGNRRLAALKTVWERIDEAQVNSDDLSEEGQQTLLASISKINCLIYTGDDTKSIAWILQGIRHISGIRDWSPTQRAELVAREIDENKLTARNVAQMLGLTTQQVNRLYRAYRALSQMREDDEYGTRAKSDYFTLFEEAIRKKDVKSWLGWNAETDRFDADENLKVFYELISKDPNREEGRRIHDPRQITSLNKIIETGRTDLLERVIDYEIGIDEAKAKIEGNEQVTDWKKLVDQAIKSLDAIPLTAISTDSTDLKVALARLGSVASRLMKAIAAAEFVTTDHPPGTD